MSEVQLLQKPVEFSTSLGLARVKTCRNRDTSHVTQQIFKQKLRVGLSPRDGASMASQFKKKKKKRPVSTASRLAQGSTRVFPVIPWEERRVLSQGSHYEASPIEWTV